MNLINQRHDWDCEIACIAMWCGKTYDEVLADAEKFEPDKRFVGRGVDTHLKEKLLKHYGRLPAVIFHAYSAIQGILSFPSLNVPGGGHALFYDGRNIFDPQSGRPDRKAYDKSPSFWPGCYNITIDLRDKHALEMFEMEVNESVRLLGHAQGKT